MSNFILSTDSSCDIMSADTCERGIYRIAMEYIVENGGKIATHRDDLSQDNQFIQFYEGLKSGDIAKTSQLTICELKEYFENIIKKEGKDVVHITLSSGLSGTYDQAVIAAKMLAESEPVHKVYVVDSLSATIGQRLLVDEAEKLRDAGVSAGDAQAVLDITKLHIHHWLIVDDLHHLKRGGRISGVAAAIGTLLDLKPFIGINQEGRLVVMGKNKGMKKSAQKAVDMIKKYGEDMEYKTVYVLTTNVRENSDMIIKAVNENFKTNVKLCFLGPVIGAHTGPGATAVAFIGKVRITNLS